MQDATPGYTCYLSRNTVSKKLSNFYEMMERA